MKPVRSANHRPVRRDAAQPRGCYKLFMHPVRIGISGWRYVPWRKVFYPAELPQRSELEFAARHFPSIELNGTFYSLQRPEYFARWASETPDGFVFSIKGGRFITHMKKLRAIDEALANFFASGILALEDKLGPFLWQFPENMPADLERFAEFFQKLPRDTTAAAKLASKHAKKLEGRALTRSHERRALRHTVEIRNPACASDAFFELLHDNDIGWVIADTAGRWPYAEALTSDLVYIRLHGDKALYQSGYSSEALRKWATKIARWRKERDVFVYFDNDVKVHAPFDALALQRLLDLPPWQPNAPLANRRRPGKLAVREAPRTTGFMQRPQRRSS